MPSVATKQLPNPDKDLLIGPELARDKALRPVYMVSLTEDQVGELKISQPDLVEIIGGAEVLDYYSMFLVSASETVVELLRAGATIEIGAVDRFSDDCTACGGIMAHTSFNVANGRQTHFRLSDGSWLGVKGAGQHQLEDEPSFFWGDPENFMLRGLAGHSSSQEDGRWLGLLPGEECERVAPRIGFLRPVDRSEELYFSQYLASRSLLAIPQGANQVQDTSEMKTSTGADLNPMLSFSRTIHPHRMNKLPQLLKADPGLTKLSQSIGQSLRALGYIEPDEQFSPVEMFELAFRNLGGSEGKKFAAGLGKVTMHLQDFNFVGQEADLEELVPIEDLPKDEAWIKYHGLSTKLIAIGKILAYTYEVTEDMYAIILPDKNRLFELFWKEFFKHLPDNELVLYEEEGNESLVADLLHFPYRWEIWHNSNPDYYFQDDTARLEVRADVSRWAKEVRESRCS